jgi:hypothetical protein
VHEKYIKKMVLKQLKKQFPYWKRLARKEKKTLAQQVLAEVGKSCPPGSHISVPLHELTGTPSTGDAKIMSISDMERFIDQHNRRIFQLPAPSRNKYLKDPELRAIDKLLDNSIIDKLLATVGFTLARRLLFPFHMLRAELLKSLKYAELSYRKYCSAQLNKLEQKTNRAFIGLPLHKKLCISHSQLSQFRAGLAFSQLVNLMVYIIHLFLKSGRLNSQFIVHGADSAELAAVCNPAPLATIEVGKKKVRIYSDLDADCGPRRKKRDKSEYFVGYRLHSLTAINPQTGHSYPLISLIAPGNHHDNLFLAQLISLGKAIGLELKVIIADEAYGDATNHEAIQREHGINIITPPKANVKLPEHVDEKTGAVYLDKWCETPMSYLGRTDAGGHEFKCSCLCPGECIHYPTCHKYREVPTDAGLFGQIPAQLEGVEELNNLRKHMERPFNLLKHREGLEPVRVRSQHGLMAVAAFANAANLLLEIVATRKTKHKENRQLKLKLAA